MSNPYPQNGPQQYGPMQGQPQYGLMPGQPQPPQKKKGGCFKWGCGGALAVIILIVIIAAAAGGGKSGSSSGTTASSSHSGGSTHKAASKPTHAAAPTVVLRNFSGSGIKNSPQFTTGSHWKVSYTYDCAKTMGAVGGSGNMIIYDETGDPLVNEMGKSGHGSTDEYTSGTHHLQVNSECAWTVNVTNG